MPARARRRSSPRLDLSPPRCCNCTVHSGLWGEMDIQVRKYHSTVEEIFHEGGARADRPLRRAAVLAAIHNPYAGQYVDDILPLMEALKGLGVEMAGRLVTLLGGDPKVVEGYGKGAIVGALGELEHGALW